MLHKMIQHRPPNQIITNQEHMLVTSNDYLSPLSYIYMTATYISITYSQTRDPEGIGVHNYVLRGNLFNNVSDCFVFIET